MTPTFPRPILALSVVGLLLAGCSSQPSRTGAGAATTSRPQATQESAARPAEGAQREERAAPETATQLPDQTGIPACDDYLASYVACHRAAAIYKPDQIQGHYEAMRTSLLRDAGDARVRPNLAARCQSLANQLRQALHGKSCAATPAATGGQAGN